MLIHLKFITEKAATPRGGAAENQQDCSLSMKRVTKKGSSCLKNSMSQSFYHKYEDGCGCYQ